MCISTGRPCHGGRYECDPHEQQEWLTLWELLRGRPGSAPPRPRLARKATELSVPCGRMSGREVRMMERPDPGGPIRRERYELLVAANLAQENAFEILALIFRSKGGDEAAARLRALLALTAANRVDPDDALRIHDTTGRLGSRRNSTRYGGNWTPSRCSSSSAAARACRPPRSPPGPIGRPATPRRNRPLEMLAHHVDTVPLPSAGRAWCATPAPVGGVHPRDMLRGYESASATRGSAVRPARRAALTGRCSAMMFAGGVTSLGLGVRSAV